MIDRKHAMISLDEKINHMMAHGMKLSWMEDIMEEDESKKGDARGPNISVVGKKLFERMKTFNKYSHQKTAYAYL